MTSEAMKLSVAVLGTYARQDLIYAMNSITSQDYPDLELLISMNELDLPACAVIDTLNANRKENLKKVWIETEKRTYPMRHHLKKISSQMQGEWLLCLWNGSALYASDSLSRCVKGADSGSLIMGIQVLFEDGRGYIGEQSGGVLFPKQFVKSASFRNLDLEKDLTLQIGKIFRFCEVPVIRTNIRPHPPCHKEYTQTVLRQNLKRWMQQLEQGRLRLNALAYTRLLRMAYAYLERHPYQERNRQKETYREENDQEKNDQENHHQEKNDQKTEEILSDMDEWIQYLIVKQKGGKWEIKDSDKALICHLTKMKEIVRNKRFTKMILRRYIKKLPHASCRRAVMVVSEYHLWRSCFQSVYDCLLCHNYEVTIVYAGFQHSQITIDADQMLEAWNRSGYEYVRCEDYDLSGQSPDVIFFCKPYDVVDEKWRIEEIEKIVRHIIYIPYQMASMRSDPESIRLMYQLPMHFLAWRQLVYNQTVADQIDRHSYHPENQLQIGHPKYDVKRKDFTREESDAYHKMRDLADGKKIVLWNSHFAIDPLHTDSVGTFFTFGIDFLKSIPNAQDLFVIWRPHPLFWENLRGGGYEQTEQTYRCMQDAVTAKKLYVDRGDSQWPAVFAADILISDASSLIESFMMLQKPVILTQRVEKETHMDAVIHKASSQRQLAQAISHLMKNGDERQEIRRRWMNRNYFLPSGGQCVAGRLAEELERELFQENDG